MSQEIAPTKSSRRLGTEIVQSDENPWKKPFVIVFHAAAATTYGFALCFQAVSTRSAQLYARTNPLVRPYGQWRFLTYNCLVIHFVAYSLCLTSHFIPRLRAQRDYVFTTFAFPFGMLVCTSFWAIWVVGGRENIFPTSLEAYYPPWLNHVSHTIILPINLIEIVTNRYHYVNERKSIVPLVGYIISYSSFLLYIRYQTGRFVYPFLNKMNAVPVGAWFVGCGVFLLFAYKGGKILHDLVHGVRNKLKPGKGIKKAIRE